MELERSVGEFHRTPPFYRVARALVYGFFHTLYDFSVYGVSRVPSRGGVVFASNHASFLDPPAIGAEIDRHLAYFARDTLWKGVLAGILDALEAIPVKRTENDVNALRKILKVLAGGGSVVVFPEGTRTPDGNFLEPKGGAGMIACRNSAIVIPTRIFGSFEAFGKGDKLPRLFGKIRVVYGEPMYPADYDPGKNAPDRYLEASTRIMDRIRALECPAEPVV